MGPRAGLDGFGTSPPPLGFDPRTCPTPWRIAMPTELSRHTVIVVRKYEYVQQESVFWVLLRIVSLFVCFC